MVATVHVPISPAVLDWLVDRSGKDPAEFSNRYARWGAWLSGEAAPTMRQAQQLARTAGVPFGYLLLERPPALELPVPDFREGHAGDLQDPSSDLLAVVHQSIRRQDWYRDYAKDTGLREVDVVGSARDLTPDRAAADMRQQLEFEVSDRRGTWNDVRKHLLRAFEGLGGLTVATSMVENNTHRLLDPDEFRGFCLVDEVAPLVFVNTNQTLNGQIFTLGHEFAHVWLGRSGISLEDPKWEPQGEIERWCNAVASEFLVPGSDIVTQASRVADRPLPEQLDALASRYRCGTLVVLQALRRHDLRRFRDFDVTYDQEVKRLRELADERTSGGGDFYANQPFRIGERFSRAIVSDALSGRTPLSDAIRLTSLRSLSSFDAYATRMGIA
ncbi:ImmA/IrrE family metallo-endopeptidase [Nocardioides sp.]|uniref:ImmA/IrrE family metallo-endopeptidase n=1 Tax=Nocardioides sp. TaxID=35761 RepID=UPI003783098F